MLGFAPLAVVPLGAVPSVATQPWIKVAGTWRTATVWLNIAGVWKEATSYVKVGTWR